MKNFDDQFFPVIGQYPSIHQVKPLVASFAEREYLGELYFDEFPDDISIPFTVGEDGMPLFIPQELALAPEFNPDKFLCIADERQYVLTGKGMILQTFQPDEVDENDLVGFDKLSPSARAAAKEPLLPEAIRRAKESFNALPENLKPSVEVTEQLEYYDSNGRLLQKFVPEEVTGGKVPFTALNQLSRNHLMQVEINRLANELLDNQLDGDPNVKVQVFPIRPACQHYHVQIVPSEDDPTRRTIVRLCAALATTNGSVYNIRDSNVLACTMRESCTKPKDRYSLKVIRDFEIEQARTHMSVKVEEDDFNVDDELNTDLGILGGK